MLGFLLASFASEGSESFFDGGMEGALSPGRGGIDFFAGVDDGATAAEDAGGGATDGGLGGTPFAPSPFDAGVVMGMSSGARFTTKRIRDTGSTAR